MDEKINLAAEEPKRKESVFWIEVDKIKPNPFQPRREFDETALQDLANSIKEYGVLQPIVVTRKEIDTGTGRRVEYELLAGERRLRASRLAGIPQIPAIIKEDLPQETGENKKLKLELALVENLQREDLNPIEKARAFKSLIDEFGMLQKEVAERVGKSREVVANTLRLLSLPEEMQHAVATGSITEGHTRPLLMLSDHPEDQKELYQNILTSNMSVRQAERAAREIAQDRARALLDPETKMLQEKLEDVLGTRVHIDKKAKGGGKISIEFFSAEELRSISERIVPPNAITV